MIFYNPEPNITLGTILFCRFFALFAAMNFALCQTSFSNLKAEASHPSELVSQLRFGEPVRVLSGDKEWRFVETEHGYRGFVRTAHLCLLDVGQLPVFLGITRLESAEIASLPYSAGAFIWDNARLLGTQNHSEYRAGQLPENLAELLAGYARFFLSVPYVWGGKTQWGLDCSGLVQLVLNIAGFSFPRDAWQQAERGEELVFSKENPAFEAGDLLFFRRGEQRIHHVAISLGGSKFIHASEWVRINSLHHKDPEYAEERAKTICSARRLKQSDLLPMRESLTQFFS